MHACVRLMSLCVHKCRREINHKERKKTNSLSVAQVRFEQLKIPSGGARQGRRGWECI